MWAAQVRRCVHIVVALCGVFQLFPAVQHFSFLYPKPALLRRAFSVFVHYCAQQTPEAYWGRSGRCWGGKEAVCCVKGARWGSLYKMRGLPVLVRTCVQTTAVTPHASCCRKKRTYTTCTQRLSRATRVCPPHSGASCLAPNSGIILVIWGHGAKDAVCVIGAGSTPRSMPISSFDVIPLLTRKRACDRSTRAKETRHAPAPAVQASQLRREPEILAMLPFLPPLSPSSRCLHEAPSRRLLANVPRQRYSGDRQLGSSPGPNAPQHTRRGTL